LLKVGEETREIDLKCVANGSQLHDIQPPFPPLVLADERLVGPKFLSQFHLRNVSSAPGGTDEFEEQFVRGFME
jgi:hypothetical protein